MRPLMAKALAFGAYDLYSRQPRLDDRGRSVPANEMWQMVCQRYHQEALSLLSKNLDLYPVYRDNGYESPLDNAARAEDSSFFVGGLTS